MPFTALSSLGAGLAKVVPGLCAVCRHWGRQRICASCLARFAAPLHRCRRCALALPEGAGECGACVREPPPFARSVTAFDYAAPWDTLIAQYKFHAALDLGPAFAAQLADAVDEAGLEPPDLVLPVPLSAARLRERGYNQAWELTRLLARRLGLRADAALLLRIGHRPQQLALSPADRADNVRGAFAVEPLRLGDLRGRKVALVDDVMTTGATAAEAARTLLQAGATQVQLWVLARTPRPQDR